MLRKIKDYLGIEGVKIELILEEEYSIKDKKLDGQIVFSSQTPKTIDSLHIKLMEKYHRGRGDSKLINDYLLGSIDLELNLQLEKDESKTIDFSLPFEIMKSEMDQMENSNILVKPFIMLAKKLKKVNSLYRVEASAKIIGTKLNPIAIQLIDLN